MKVQKISITIFAFAALAVVRADEENSAFIVRGEDATIDQHPYMAGVLNEGRFTCTGAIISPRSVLTVRKVK